MIRVTVSLLLLQLGLVLAQDELAIIGGIIEALSLSGFGKAILGSAAVSCLKLLTQPLNLGLLWESNPRFSGCVSSFKHDTESR